MIKIDLASLPQQLFQSDLVDLFAGAYRAMTGDAGHDIVQWIQRGHPIACGHKRRVAQRLHECLHVFVHQKHRHGENLDDPGVGNVAQFKA